MHRPAVASERPVQPVKKACAARFGWNAQHGTAIGVAVQLEYDDAAAGSRCSGIAATRDDHSTRVTTRGAALELTDDRIAWINLRIERELHRRMDPRLTQQAAIKLPRCKQRAT